MSELAVALLFAALLTPSSAPVATPARVTAQSTVAPTHAGSAARTERDVREPQPTDKRTAKSGSDVKPSTVAQAPAVTK